MGFGITTLKQILKVYTVIWMPMTVGSKSRMTLLVQECQKLEGSVASVPR